MKVYYVSVNKWSDFNPRKDLKNPTWFRMENRFLESVTGLALTNDERVIWIYLLSQRTKTAHDLFAISSSHVSFVCRVQLSELESCLKKLQDCDLISINVGKNGRLKKARTGPVQNPNVSVQNLCSTRRDETERNDTERDVTIRDTGTSGDVSGSSPADAEEGLTNLGQISKLYKLWNEVTGTEKKISMVVLGKISPAREKLILAAMKFEPSFDEWEKIFRKVVASDFLSGKAKTDRPFSAKFDWVLNPNNTTKIMEGNYDSEKPTEIKRNLISMNQVQEDEENYRHRLPPPRLVPK